MTYGNIIDRCDELVANDMSEAEKIELLFEFELDIMQNVMLLSQAELDNIPYPNRDTGLIIRRPHTKLYRLWLCSLLHKSNGDYSDAANMVSDFEAARIEFVQWYGDTCAPGRGQAVYKGYYLSAYSLAVMYGYDGTVEEWLKSLIGPPGDKGDDYVISQDDYSEIAAYCAEHYTDKIAEMNSALAEFKNNVAIGVYKGDPGTPGQDGTSVEHRWDGTMLIVTSASGTSTTDLKGDKGDTGNDGHTPIKGVDYFTEEDIHDFVYAKVPEGLYGGEMPFLCGMLYFPGEGYFDAFKENTESTNKIFDVNHFVLINDVPKYVWSATRRMYLDFSMPVRGKDYWTDEDKSEIKSYVDEAILGGAW